MKQENKAEILFLIELLQRINEIYADSSAVCESDYEALCEDIDFVYFRLKALKEENEFTRKALEFLSEALHGCLNMNQVFDIISLTAKANEQLKLWNEENVK